MNATFKSGESFNDLVFENRNKTYGAYVLRKSYRNNMSMALFLGSAFIGALVLAAVMMNSRHLVKDFKEMLADNDSLLVVQMDVTPDVIPPSDPDPKPPVEDKTPYSDILGGEPSDDPSDHNMKTKDNAIINPNGTEQGKDSAIHENPITELPKGPFVPEKKKEPIYIVDKMPEFPEGITKYVSEHLRYPQGAVEIGTEGTVFLTFIVEEDGSVSNVKVLKDIGDGCGQEAARVIKGMPKWIPGYNKLGESQRVVLNLPVKFRIK